jgi:hypothetical protein
MVNEMRRCVDCMITLCWFQQIKQVHCNNIWFCKCLWIMIAFYTLLTLLFCIVNNICVVYGDQVHQHSVDILMGTNCAPLFADLLHSYEAEFVQKLLLDNIYILFYSILSITTKQLSVSWNHEHRRHAPHCCDVPQYDVTIKEYASTYRELLCYVMLAASTLFR